MTAGPDAATELGELCAREGLTVVERLDTASGAARFAAHVVDERGRHSFLKRGNGLRGKGEIAVLRAYAATGHTPGHLRPIDDETFLSDWVAGVPLDQTAEPPAGLLHRCGRTLKDLHGVAVPGVPLMPIRERVSPPWVERDLGGELSGPMRRAAMAAAGELSDYSEHEAVVLHGDAVPQNILVAGTELVVIDPIGFTGPAGWDVAQLAVALGGRGRREHLATLIRGYGEAPAKVESAFAYLTFLFLATYRGRAREGQPVRPAELTELEDLARSLAE